MLNQVNTARTGTQTLFYSCESLGSTETAVRAVAVNNRPKIFLTGDAKTLSLLDVEYVDQGAVCTDKEDGLITSWGFQGLGSPQQLPVLRAGYQGAATGSVENVFDGDDQCGTACASYVSVAAADAYLWVDLGAGKVVHSVTLAGDLTGGRLQVGPEPNMGPDCAASVDVASSTALPVTCSAPLAGRFVTLVATSMQVCEIEVNGTVGPAPASRINITGCGLDYQLELAGHDAAGLGVMYSIQAPGEYQELRTDLGTGPILQIELVSSRVPGTPGSEIWVLRDADGNETAWAMAGQSFLPLNASYWTVTADSSCSITLAVDPADSCSWLFGSLSE